MIQQWWEGVARPTLTRRLLLTQMAMVAMLWAAAAGLMTRDEALGTAEFESRAAIDNIFAAVDALHDRPERLRNVLDAKAQAYAADPLISGVPELAFQFSVLRDGREIYRSDGAPMIPTTTRQAQVEEVSTAGHTWRVRSVSSQDGRTYVTLMKRYDPWLLFKGRNWSCYFASPLLMSLPFLLLPAWLAIRIATRPWRQLAKETASRGVDDLSPLKPAIQYAETQVWISSINGLMRRVANGLEQERSFVSDAAHELRTPIAALRLNAEALASHNARGREDVLLQGIQSSADRAGRLVNQLLTLRRNESHQSAPNVCLQVDELLQERLAILAAFAANKKVELELECEPELHICGRHESLVSIFDNVIDNAIKYSPAGTTVSVHASLHQGVVCVCVEDQGPGIPAELRERVFDRFYRLPDRQQNGSGLGLSIVRAAATANQGTVTLHTGKNGHGLCVTVTLPAVLQPKKASRLVPVVATAQA